MNKKLYKKTKQRLNNLSSELYTLSHLLKIYNFISEYSSEIDEGEKDSLLQVIRKILEEQKEKTTKIRTDIYGV